jgi:hypothetical protein
VSKKLLLLVLCLVLPLSSGFTAQHKGSGSHSRSTKSQNTSAKTVHVRSYKKKNGTVVRSYNRRPPKSKQTDETSKDHAAQ